MKLVISIVLAATATAHATPDYEGGVALSAGMSGYGTPVYGVGLGGRVIGGARISDALWVRGIFGGARMGDIEDSGNETATSVGVGIDVRSCNATNVSCASAGIDLAGFRAAWTNFDDPLEDHGHVWGALASPHAGVDFGGDLRFTTDVQLDVGYARRTFDTGTKNVGVGGLTFSIGMVVRI